MRHNNETETTGKPISLQTLADHFPTEQVCRDYLEAARWNGDPSCPYCWSYNISKFKDGKLYFCGKCRRHFTVTVGTIFEKSHIPLRKWFFAVYIIVAHRKGISSLQLSRDLQVTQKTAWFMNHRIRYALEKNTFSVPFTDIVEIDETYVGGKTRRLGDPPLKRGRGSEKQTPVIAITERKGNIVTIPVKKVTAKNLERIANQYVEVGARVMTDEFGGYRTLGQDYKHETVNHSKREYVRGDVYTNTVEGFFGLLKRGIFGIYHSVSPKHLHRYCNEFAYRWNIRKEKDVDRFAMALHKCESRLTYKVLIGGKQNETKTQAEASQTSQVS